jgi:hypothetical protein
MRYLLCGIAFFSFIIPSSGPCLAQETAHTFDELKHVLETGDKVQVITDSGKKIHGQIAEISSSSLVLAGKDQRAFSEDTIMEIKKRHPDRWWNGALIGFGAGTATGLLINHSSCGDDPECLAIGTAVFVLPSMAIGAVTGALIDHSMKRFDTVFLPSKASGKRSLKLAPVYSKDKKGVSLSLSF